MSSVNTPVLSEIIKHRDVEEPKKRSREDWKKAKELEEARKAGNAPAAVDEEGKDINPHLPQYISSAPWYFGAKTATLKHQRPQTDKQKQFNKINEYYERGRKGAVSTYFREGACENCGAITHKKKECLERPRKFGARYTGAHFAPDEVLLPKLDLDYDGKRDAWNGYDPEDYQTVIKEYAKVEEAKKKLKEEKLKQDMMSGEADDPKEQADLDDDEDDEKYADRVDMPGTKVDSKERITVRNLRLREDTAKYLRNLDLNSAHYDPKSRAMRDNPYKHTRKSPEELSYAGDNFVRCGGDALKHSEMQSFAWDAYEKNIDVHSLADPTKSELLHQEFQVKKEEFRHSIEDGILKKYGGEEHLEVPPKELIFAQTEDYVEYSRQGKVIKGTEKAIVRSKYEEDVYINNHTSVWGSFWQDHKWGYKCCHSFLKNSYCTGNSGKEALSEASRVVLHPPEIDKKYQACESQATSESVCEVEKPKAIDLQIGIEKLPVKKKKDQHKEERQLRKEEKKRRRKEEKRQHKKEKRQRKKEKRQRKKEKRQRKKEEKQRQNRKADEDQMKAKRLKKALKKEEEQQRQAVRLLAMDERKRPYNSMYEDKAPTEEEMEAYFMKRQRPDDPMASFRRNW